MLMPKKVKFRKQQRGRMRGKAWRGGEVSFGDYGVGSNHVLPTMGTARFSSGLRASDFANNVSPLSDAAAAATTAAPNDTTPPPTPPNFYGQNWGCEVELDWDESQDDTAEPFAIQYEIFVNGVLDHTLTLRYTKTIVYGTFNDVNEFSVVAVDTAGNRSAPAVLNLSLDGC